MSGLAGGNPEKAAAFSQLLSDLMAVGKVDKARVDSIRHLLDQAEPADLVNVVHEAVERVQMQGKDLESLKPAVSKLINLMSSALERHRLKPDPENPLFASLIEENKGLLSVMNYCKSLAKAAQEIRARDKNHFIRDLDLQLLQALEPLSEVEGHYRKKENVLFPWFEKRYPNYRCVHLMWDIQDDVRRSLAAIQRIFDKIISLTEGQQEDYPKEIAHLNWTLGRLFFDLGANIQREEVALYPLMASLLSKDEAADLFCQCAEYGWPFLDQEKALHYQALAARISSNGTQEAASASAGFHGRTGSLNPRVLAALFARIPMDMTFVDQDDKVSWFSDSPHRIFARSPAIVGRDVRNCHPGASVGRVVAILEAFKAGRKDREAFWLNMGGRMIHIEYLALRGDDGSYLGTLECSQDISGYRSLEGEKRLADN